MSKKSALGKGMEGLLPTGFDVGAVASPGEKVQQLDVSKIYPNESQPRKTFDSEALKELSQSIAEHGVIQPLIVGARKGSGKHEIIAGERRWRASKLAGLKTVPAIVRDTKEQQKLEIAIIENVQRVDLTPLEEAMSIYKLKHEFSLSLQEIAKKLGKASTTISNTMRLLQLTKRAKEALMNNEITEGHARALLSLTDVEQQDILLNTIITHNLSVREAEQAAKNIKAVKTEKLTPAAHKAPFTISKDTKQSLAGVSKKLATQLSFNASKSQLLITVENENTLKDILNKLDRD